jgi:hypothetical protein
MARTTTLRLKVDTDTTPVTELAPRVKTAALDALKAADVASLMLDAEAVAGQVAAEVMAVILRVRQATPAESAQARAIERVRALHLQVYNACDWCSTNDRHVVFPCPTVRALDGEGTSSA